MTTQTITLTDFLLARIAEDKAVAQAMSAFDNAPRALVECEAKRRIVGYHNEVHVCDGPNLTADPDVLDWSDGYGGPCYTLMALALPYADHPDYREEWKP